MKKHIFYILAGVSISIFLSYTAMATVIGDSMYVNSKKQHNITVESGEIKQLGDIAISGVFEANKYDAKEIEYSKDGTKTIALNGIGMLHRDPRIVLDNKDLFRGKRYYNNDAVENDKYVVYAETIFDKANNGRVSGIELSYKNKQTKKIETMTINETGDYYNYNLNFIGDKNIILTSNQGSDDKLLIINVDLENKKVAYNNKIELQKGEEAKSGNFQCNTVILGNKLIIDANYFSHNKENNAQGKKQEINFIVYDGAKNEVHKVDSDFSSGDYKFFVGDDKLYMSEHKNPGKIYELSADTFKVLNTINVSLDVDLLERYFRDIKIYDNKVYYIFIKGDIEQSNEMEMSAYVYDLKSGELLFKGTDKNANARVIYEFKQLK
jgi:hypothetical protein